MISVATEDEIDSGHDPAEVGGRYAPNAFSEEFPIDRDDLGDIGNRILGQSCRRRGERDISRRHNPLGAQPRPPAGVVDAV